MSGLSPSARALLGEHRAHADALAGDGHGAWPAIARRIERGDAPLELDDPPRSRRGVAVIAAVLVATAALLLAWLAGAAQVLGEADDAAPSEAIYDAPGDDAGAAAAIRVPEPPPQTSVRRHSSAAPASAAAETDTTVPPAVPPSKRTAVRARVDDDPSDDLEDVRRLATARAALRDGDAAAALRILQAMDRAHPKSAYAEEREVLVVSALCNAGRRDEARTAAARFRRVHPRSPLLAHLARGCGESP